MRFHGQSIISTENKWLNKCSLLQHNILITQILICIYFEDIYSLYYINDDSPSMFASLSLECLNILKYHYFNSLGFLCNLRNVPWETNFYLTLENPDFLLLII